MRAINRRFPFRALLGAVLTLSLLACASPLTQAPPTGGGGEVVNSGDSGHLNSADPLREGTVSMTIRWPEQPQYQAQVIPARTNSIRIRIMDAADTVIRQAHHVRPSGGTVETTASLTIAAGINRRVVAEAFDTAHPDDNALAIAAASQTLDIEPGVETQVVLNLAPTMPPEIADFPRSGGPGALIVIKGANFEYHGGQIAVSVGGVGALNVWRQSSTQLTVEVPANAMDGPITVISDGVSTTSTAIFRVIRSLEVLPATPSVVVDEPVMIDLTAKDQDDFGIPLPVVNWSVLPPDDEAEYTFENGAFTASTTGVYEFTAKSGTIEGKASVEVVSP